MYIPKISIYPYLGWFNTSVVNFVCDMLVKLKNLTSEGCPIGRMAVHITIASSIKIWLNFMVSIVCPLEIISKITLRQKIDCNKISISQ